MFVIHHKVYSIAPGITNKTLVLPIRFQMNNATDPLVFPECDKEGFISTG